jgi:prevent-host-death family protein
VKKANISQLKNSLSRYLDYVRDGGTVRIFDRDRPVADLVPVAHPSSKGASSAASKESSPLEEILEDLVRKGILRRGSGEVPPDFLRRKLPRPRRSVVEALIEERREGR